MGHNQQLHAFITQRQENIAAHFQVLQQYMTPLTEAITLALRFLYLFVVGVCGAGAPAL